MPHKDKIRKAFSEHGVPLEDTGSSQYRGHSPFTGKKGEKKLYVNKLTGAWDDKITGKSGGFRNFFEEKTKINEARFAGKPARELGKDRGLRLKTLRTWRVGWDGKQYTIPVDGCGKFYDLRRYTLGGRPRGTSGANISFLGVVQEGEEEAWICEGEWDAMALWEALQETGVKASVYAAPGASAFPQHALTTFQGRKIFVAYDNDEAGNRGCLRVQKMLAGVAADLAFVHWPEEFPEGFDVRDFYHSKGKETLKLLRSMLRPECPGGNVSERIPSAAEEAESLNGKGLAPKEVVRRYRKHMFIPDPEVLDVIFGTMFANRLGGDPLWILLVAPPGGSKTMFLQSMITSPLTRFISSLTPRTLVSGAMAQGGGDASLLPQLNGRVLIIKDFTTILTLPVMHRDEIFGTLREAYDGAFVKGWGTGLVREYNSQFGIVAAVTPVIERYSHGSVLGERFIRYRLPYRFAVAGDESLIDAALATIGREAESRAKLEETGAEVLSRPVTKDDIPKFPKDILVRFRKLSQWVSRLRGVVSRERYTGNVEFKPTAEVGTRLAKQFAKLAMGVAIYHFKTDVDEDIYQVIASVAKSTIPDKVEEIVKQLYLQGKGEYVSCSQLGTWARFEQATVRAVLQDLELLKIVQKSPDMERGKPVYRLNPVMTSLMDDLELYRKELQWQQAKRDAENDGKKKRRKPVRKPIRRKKLVRKKSRILG